VRVRVALLLFALAGCSDSAGPDRVDKGHPWADLYGSFDDQFKELLAGFEENVIAYDDFGRKSLTSKITVTGTSYDLGYRVGLMGQALDYEMRAPNDQALNQAIFDMYASIHPPYLEKVRGIAASYGMSLEEVDMIYLEHVYPTHLFWELFRFQEFPNFEEFIGAVECSALSLFSGSLNLANKQMDGGWEFPRFVVHSKLAGMHEVITNTAYPITHGMNDGMNEAGLFIGFAGNAHPDEFWDWGPQEYPDGPAISHTHAARIALERCSTVAEVIEFFQSIRIYVPSKQRHFLIADAQGASVVLEWDLETFDPVVFPREGSYQVMTNTSLQIGFDGLMEDCWRFRTANEMFSLGVTDYDGFFEVVKAIQMPPEWPAKTVWSTIADLNQRELHVYPWEFQNQIHYTFGFAQ